MIETKGITQEEQDAAMLEWQLFSYTYCNLITKIPGELLDGTRHVDDAKLNSLIAEMNEKQEKLKAAHGTNEEAAMIMELANDGLNLLDAYLDYCAEQYDIRIAE